MTVDRAVYLTCAFLVTVLSHGLLAQLVSPTWAFWTAVGLTSTGALFAAFLILTATRRPARHGGTR